MMIPLLNGAPLSHQLMDAVVFMLAHLVRASLCRRKQRIYNHLLILGKVQNASGAQSLPNFEMLVLGRDCVCNSTHCFSAVTCDRHRAKPYLNFPYVQWYDERDGPWTQADRLLRDEIAYGRTLEWGKRASMAVFRGTLNPMTTIQGLPNDAFSYTLTSTVRMEYARGKLLHIQQNSTGYLNVSLTPVAISADMNNKHYIKWLRRLEKLGIPNAHPPKLSLRDQARDFKYGIYAEGSCGWADRLKWMLALGIVPLLQVPPWLRYLIIRPGGEC